jgi:peptidoglycan/LPS O-acetylase OafA/YrhL
VSRKGLGVRVPSSPQRIKMNSSNKQLRNKEVLIKLGEKTDLNRSYYLRIDILKFLAISLIVVFHYVQNVTLISSNIVTLWVKNGSTGVTLFFVLSGFLHTFSRLNSQKNYSYIKYIIRRAIRVFPLYFFILFVAFSIYREQFNSEYIIGALLLNIDLETYRSISIFGPLWIIAILFKFYLIFPILFNQTKKHINYLVYLIIFLEIVHYLTYSAYAYGGSSYYSLLGRFIQILIGMLLGFFIKTGKYNVGYALILIIFPIAVLTWIFMYPVTVHSIISPDLWNIFHLSFEAILWTMFLGGMMLMPHINLNNVYILKDVGKITYPMFILHIIVIDSIKQTFPALQIVRNPDLNLFIIATTIILPSTVMISYLAYKAIEEPFRSYK